VASCARTDGPVPQEIATEQDLKKRDDHPLFAPRRDLPIPRHASLAVKRLREPNWRLYWLMYGRLWGRLRGLDGRLLDALHRRLYHRIYDRSLP
jgi:hypothetical protein